MRHGAQYHVLLIEVRRPCVIMIQLGRPFVIFASASLMCVLLEKHFDEIFSIMHGIVKHIQNIPITPSLKSLKVTGEPLRLSLRRELVSATKSVLVLLIQKFVRVLN